MQYAQSIHTDAFNRFMDEAVESLAPSRKTEKSSHPSEFISLIDDAVEALARYNATAIDILDSLDVETEPNRVPEDFEM